MEKKLRAAVDQLNIEAVEGTFMVSRMPIIHDLRIEYRIPGMCLILWDNETWGGDISTIVRFCWGRLAALQLFLEKDLGSHNPNENIPYKK